MSKLPDFKEISSMTSKLFKDISSSVKGIVEDYKQKRAEAEAQEKVAEVVNQTEVKPTAPPVVKPEVPPTVTPVKAKEPESPVDSKKDDVL